MWKKFLLGSDGTACKMPNKIDSHNLGKVNIFNFNENLESIKDKEN